MNVNLTKRQLVDKKKFRTVYKYNSQYKAIKLSILFKLQFITFHFQVAETESWYWFELG